jgi:hypothetical protein
MTRHRILGAFALFACLLLAWPSLAQQSRELWVARHDGPISNNDTASAIAVDSSGNSYVAGGICIDTYSWGQCLTTSWQTVKYDTNGNALWAASFAGTEGCGSWPSAIAVDAYGNSYVTGSVCVAAACDELSCFESYWPGTVSQCASTQTEAAIAIATSRHR